MLVGEGATQPWVSPEALLSLTMQEDEEPPRCFTLPLRIASQPRWLRPTESLEPEREREH